MENKINWLSILRGMTILLVVMDHVRLLNISTGNCYQFIFTINELFLPFRMPTFIIVSGALLYYSRISRGWNTLALYRDKIIRLGMPLIFCTILGNLMQMLFNSFVKNPHEVTLETFLKSFVLVQNLPWPHRWYLMTLSLIMALYPLFIIKKSKAVDILILVTLFAIRCIDFQQCGSDDWFGILSLNKYLPFFYFGIVVFKNRWYECLASWKTAIGITTAYVLLYVMNVVTIPNFITLNFPIYELLGVAMIVSLSMQIDKQSPRMFSYFSGYIFQIYLFGIAFQAFIELIIWRGIGCPHQFFTLFYLLNISAGIYIPVIISKIVERFPYRWVRLCFGLK